MRRLALWRALFALVPVLALAWSCRGSLAGTPIADDFAFLERWRFHQPLDGFDSMGAAWYWRPLGRQLYFSLLGPLVLAAPRVVAAIHLALLAGVGILLYRIARHRFTPPLAAAIAAFPLLSEPARTLIVWPSGGQHLLAAFFATLAIERALARRTVVATLAALAGMLAHEAAAPALIAVPIIVWFQQRSKRTTLHATLVALAALVAWSAGYALARAHGVTWPAGASPGSTPWSSWPELLARTIVSQLNLEDPRPFAAPFLVAGYVAIALWAFALLLRRGDRDRLRGDGPAIAGACLWLALGVLPLLFVLPDWNAWRTLVPALGLGLALTATLDRLAPRLAAAFVSLRFLALILAMPAAATVAAHVPATRSDFSFRRMARLERTVESTRRVLATRATPLPRGARIAYWLIPERTEVAFHDSSAVRVWTGDPTATWTAYGGVKSLRRNDPVDALVEYDGDEAWPAALITPEALRYWGQSLAALEVGQIAHADSLLTATIEAQQPVSEPLVASVARLQARVALARGEIRRADSLNRMDLRYAGESAATREMAARLALARIVGPELPALAAPRDSASGAAISATSRLLNPGRRQNPLATGRGSE